MNQTQIRLEINALLELTLGRTTFSDVLPPLKPCRVLKRGLLVQDNYRCQ